METVLQVIYLVFNEGYSASSGESLTRPDLSGEAIRLGRLLWNCCPRPRSIGLVALMLLHESRRAARTSPDGEIICSIIRIARCGTGSRLPKDEALVRRAMSSAEIGPYSLQAAIAAVHADAASPDATDWAQIVALYDILRESCRRRSSS